MSKRKSSIGTENTNSTIPGISINFESTNNGSTLNPESINPNGIENSGVKSDLTKWIGRYTGHKSIVWDRLPDIDLYMDQVVTYLERQLIVFQKSEDDKIITASMINNYTKDHVIPRTESKKYSREHIALLLIVCSLKKVMSMPDLTALLKEFQLQNGDDLEKFYDLFNEVQVKAIKKTASFVSDALSDSEGEPDEKLLRNLALRLEVESQMQCIAGEQILSLLKDKRKQ